MDENKSGSDKQVSPPEEETKKNKSFFSLSGILSHSGTIIALLVMIGAVGLRFVDPGFVERMRMGVFDEYNRLKPRVPQAQSPVVIVDIDEKTLLETEQWPWPRNRVAQLVSSLQQQGAVVVGFDIVFAEPDKTNPDKFAEYYEEDLSSATIAEIQTLQSNDEKLAETLRNMRSVIGQAGTKAPSVKESSAASLETTFAATLARDGATNSDPTEYMVRQPTLVSNIDMFEESATSRGVFSVDQELDGIIRRVPVVTKIEGVIKPSLSTQMLHTALGGDSIFLTLNRGGIADVRLRTPQGKFVIPTDQKGRVWVYYAKPDVFNTPNNVGRMYVSATDIIHNRVPGRVAGKLAILGTSAVGLVDIRATPIAPRLPGVEVHANILETMLEKNYLVYPVEMQGYELLMILVSGLLMIIMIPRLGPFWTLGVLVIGTSGLAGLSWYLFTEEQTLLDWTFPVSSTFATFFVLAFSNYVRDAAEKRQVRSAFGQYLSPDLVEQLAENPDQLTLGGEMKTMSLLFCDVRGFTTISESFKTDPQGLTYLINRLLTPLTNEILSRNGTIDKYMGDCIMAFWNAPIEDDRQELHSVEAAHAMFVALEELNQEREQEAKEEGKPFLPLNVGIGINTGDCVVGNMGSEQRFDYSVLGDAVNLAARLEGQSKSYGVDIVLGPDTAEKVKDSHAILELDLIAVKGKTEAVRIFTSIGAIADFDSQEFDSYKARFNEMQVCYRSQNWQEATAIMDELADGLKGVMAKYFDIMKERIVDYKETPPPADWDGVYVATTK